MLIDPGPFWALVVLNLPALAFGWIILIKAVMAGTGLGPQATPCSYCNGTGVADE